MWNRMMHFCVMVSCGAVLVVGCAKKELAKSDEPLAPTIKPAETAPATPKESVLQETVKEAKVVKEEPIKAMESSTSAVSLDTIYFDFDSFVLSPATRDTLQKNADFLLKKNTTVKVRIEGNCDERGSDEYNLALGEKRAKAALNYLVTLGVPAGRLSFISYGEEKPADPGHDEAAWAKNRRDDFVVIY